MFLWLARWDDFRTANWLETLQLAEWFMKEKQPFTTNDITSIT